MKNKIHYAWFICLACALMMFLAYGVLSNVFAVYVPFIVEENNFTYSQGSALSGIRSITGIIAAFTINFLCEKFDVKKICVFSLILMFISRLMFSVGGSYGIYVAGSAIAGFSSCYCGVVPTSIIIGRWFKSKRNLALGLTSAGSGFANILLSPAVTGIITTYGLFNAFIFEASVIFFLGIIIIFLLKNSPDSCKKTVYDRGENISKNNVKNFDKSVSNKAWALVMFCVFLFASPAYAGFLNIPSILDEFGYDKVVIGWLISYVGLTLIIGKISFGRLGDLLGGFKANFFVMAGSVSAMFILATCLGSKSIFPPIISITLMGIGMMQSTVCQPLWSRELRGNKGYDRAVGQLNIAYAIGSLVHSFVYSFMVDIFGSYAPAFLMSGLLSLIGMLLIQMVYIKNKLHHNI